MYKYNCRKCPIRNRCIDESANAPTVKDIIRRSFAARTDTLDTWGLLQPNCLLLKAEEERARTDPRESMLSRRLRQAREAREQVSKALSPSSDQQPDYLQPVPPTFSGAHASTPVATPGGIGMRGREKAPPSASSGQALGEGMLGRDRIEAPPRWLIIPASSRHVTLPANRELVLGRFDPNFGVPPDVDLSFEDQQPRTVSRQHARIVGVAGRHSIEDLGSGVGVIVNGHEVRSAPAHQLQLGDQIRLGSVQLIYEAVPAPLLDLPLAPDVRHFLMVTPTGRKLTVTPPKDIVIGRSDRYVDSVPNIDLGREGDIAVRVSRRHAIITWRHGIPYVEDLGSGFGTRLNGETLLIGHAMPLKPGDHMWLGGCVLAYDVDL